jgi:hypothetical protein
MYHFGLRLRRGWGPLVCLRFFGVLNFKGSSHSHNIGDFMLMKEENMFT